MVSLLLTECFELSMPQSTTPVTQFNTHTEWTLDIIHWGCICGVMFISLIYLMLIKSVWLRLKFHNCTVLLKFNVWLERLLNWNIHLLFLWCLYVLHVNFELKLTLKYFYTRRKEIISTLRRNVWTSMLMLFMDTEDCSLSTNG